MNRIQQKESKVFGETAKAIHEGEIFVASVGSVEGRTVVTLTPGKYCKICDAVVDNGNNHIAEHKKLAEASQNE